MFLLDLTQEVLEMGRRAKKIKEKPKKVPRRLDGEINPSAFHPS